MSISEKLIDLQIISGEKTAEVFETIYPDILDLEYEKPSDFITELWSRYKFENLSASLNGNVFEGILAVTFFREGILPVYVQAKLAFVPNIDFDFVIYTEQRGPIVLSAKTSLRERYKQADLEGMMIRQVHRRSKSFLITMEKNEAVGANRKIESGLILGIDEVVVADTSAFDRLVDELKSYRLLDPEPIEVLTSTRFISG